MYHYNKMNPKEMERMEKKSKVVRNRFIKHFPERHKKLLAADSKRKALSKAKQ